MGKMPWWHLRNWQDSTYCKLKNISMKTPLQIKHPGCPPHTGPTRELIPQDSTPHPFSYKKALKSSLHPRSKGNHLLLPLAADTDIIQEVLDLQACRMQEFCSHRSLCQDLKGKPGKPSSIWQEIEFPQEPPDKVIVSCENEAGAIMETPEVWGARNMEHLKREATSNKQSWPKREAMWDYSKYGGGPHKHFEAHTMPQCEKGIW